MEIVINEKSLRVPIKSWLPYEALDPAALNQLRAAARHPDVAAHVAVMPDCHVGAAVTIGCVFPTAGAVVPAAVGTDIGCGMAAVATGLAYDPARMDGAFWAAWAARVQAAVPTGFGAHRRALPWPGFAEPVRARALQAAIHSEAVPQLGTLRGRQPLPGGPGRRPRSWIGRRPARRGSCRGGPVCRDPHRRRARSVPEAEATMTERSPGTTVFDVIATAVTVSSSAAGSSSRWFSRSR
jgi:hypothetical protein